MRLTANRLFTRLTLLIALVVTCTPTAVIASVVPPEQPAIKRAPAPWIGLAIMFIMLAIIMFISLLPSKRSHQD